MKGNKMNIIICKKCKVKFKYYIINDNFPGGKDKESVNCPQCAHPIFFIMTSGIVKTEAISQSK